MEVASGQLWRGAARGYDVSASFSEGEAGRSSVANESAAPAHQGRPPGGGRLARHLLEWVEAEPNITIPEQATKLSAEKDVTANQPRLPGVAEGTPVLQRNSAGLEGQTRGRAPGA